MVTFTGYKEYRKISPAGIRKVCGYEPIVIIDGKNVIDSETFINTGFVYKSIGRGDMNEHQIGIEVP